MLVKTKKIPKRDLFSKEILEIVKNWKLKYFRDFRIFETITAKQAIQDLNEDLNTHFSKSVILTFQTYGGKVNSYNPEIDEIILPYSAPSILVFLHEYGHSLLGDNESHVRKWTYWILRHCFKSAYTELIKSSKLQLPVK